MKLVILMLVAIYFNLNAKGAVLIQDPLADPIAYQGYLYNNSQDISFANFYLEETQKLHPSIEQELSIYLEKKWSAQAENLRQGKELLIKKILSHPLNKTSLKLLKQLKDDAHLQVKNSDNLIIDISNIKNLEYIIFNGEIFDHHNSSSIKYNSADLNQLVIVSNSHVPQIFSGHNLPEVFNSSEPLILDKGLNPILNQWPTVDFKAFSTLGNLEKGEDQHPLRIESPTPKIFNSYNPEAHWYQTRTGKWAIAILAGLALWKASENYKIVVTLP